MEVKKTTTTNKHSAKIHIHTQTCTQPMNKITHPTLITQPTDAHYATCTHITVYKNMLRNLHDELKQPTHTSD